MILPGRVQRVSALRAVFCFIDVKKFFTFFILVPFLRFLKFFKRFLFLKNVGKVQRGKQVNK